MSGQYFFRKMNSLHVQMERLMEKDTLHVLLEEGSLFYWNTVDKTHALLLTHQSVTLIISLAKVEMKFLASETIHCFIATALFRMALWWPHSSGNYRESCTYI